LLFLKTAQSALHITLQHISSMKHLLTSLGSIHPWCN